MYVNGEHRAIIYEISLYDFLLNEGYDIDRVAVEKNKIIVHKRDFETEMLCDSDRLEIVHFVGGG